MIDEPKLSPKTLAEMEAGRRALAAKTGQSDPPPQEKVEEVPPKRTRGRKQGSDG